MLTLKQSWAKFRLCKLLGILYPIIQGGMAWVSDAVLAAAVSNAGGLGIIGSGKMTPELLETEIKKIQEFTSKPWGVNLMLLNPHIDALIDLVIAYKVPVVTLGAGNAGIYIPRLKEAGIIVIPVVASVALAVRAERSGADAIIGEGMEAGGHIGDLTTMTLIPQLVSALSIPVIAAGGISDGRGMAAAFGLGADGVQMGTRFMCADECTIDPAVKERVLKARDRDTIVTGYSTGHPVRILKNKLSKMLQDLDRANKPDELEELGEGTLALAMREGDVGNGSVMAGQCAAMVSEVLPAAKILENTMSDFIDIVRSNAQRYVGE